MFARLGAGSPKKIGLMTAKQIITDLKSENNMAFGQLYTQHFGMVRRFVENNSGCVQDAEDIFQDAMVVLVEKLRRDDFMLTASLKTYVMAISKNIWLKQLRNARHKNMGDVYADELFFEEIDRVIEEERSYRDILQSYLHRITEHCKGLIHDMFFKEKTIEQIQKEYGYSSRHNAQNQKHKCVEQIRRVKEADENKKN